MRKTRDIHDIKIAALAIGVSFASLFLAFPLIYIFIYHYAYTTPLSDPLVKVIAFVIVFLVFLSSASLWVGLAGAALNVYYRLARNKKTKTLK